MYASYLNPSITTVTAVTTVTTITTVTAISPWIIVEVTADEDVSEANYTKEAAIEPHIPYVSNKDKETSAVILGHACARSCVSRLHAMGRGNTGRAKEAEQKHQAREKSNQTYFETRRNHGLSHFLLLRRGSITPNLPHIYWLTYIIMRYK
jgi:hypothetical protein